MRYFENLPGKTVNDKLHDENDTPQPSVKPVMEDDTSKDKTDVCSYPNKDKKVGDIIYFGKYKQDNSASDIKKDIAWRVLAVENDKALLLSDKILDCKPYNDETKVVTWETCTLRKWLNENFYAAAFTTKEQSSIALTEVINENNPDYGTKRGNDTKDKLFLLSYSEVRNTAFGFNYDISYFDTARQAQGLAFSKSKGLYASEFSSYSENSYWWLRSPGGNQGRAGYIDSCGSVAGDGHYVNYTYVGVRPSL